MNDANLVNSHSHGHLLHYQRDCLSGALAEQAFVHSNRNFISYSIILLAYFKLQQTASMALGKAFHVAADRVHFSPTSGYKWKDASKADRPGQAGESAAAPGVISQSYDALLHLMQRDVFMAKHTTTTAAAAAAAPALLEPVAPTPIPAAPIQPVGLIPSTPRSAGSSTGPDTGKTKAESQAGPASAKKLKTKK